MTTRFRPPLAGTTLLLLVAGCSARADDAGHNATASLSIGSDAAGNALSGNATQSVSIDVPGFSARVNVPNLDLGSDTTKIENMRIFPGTKIDGVKIAGQAGSGSDEGGRGDVEMGFTAPADAARIVAWYREQAQKSGWTIASPANGNQFEATREGTGAGIDGTENGSNGGKGTTRFALQVADSGGGSQGRFFVSGH